MNIESIFDFPVENQSGVYIDSSEVASETQKNTNEAFGEKWVKADNEEMYSDEYTRFQENWYLSLYGFESEEVFKNFLKDKNYILDAGCGYGDKTAWIAALAPHATVVGVDYSDAIFSAKRRHGEVANLFFIKGDIGKINFKKKTFDYVSCDQVLQHTDDPPRTFAHLNSLVKDNGEFACFVYAKKALPRELLDEYFREKCVGYSKEQIWEMSEQLTELGKRLSELNIEIDIPEIPLLGIKGGKQDLQRFIYWDFIKCFWNPEHGVKSSVATNFDWYSPQNAFRYSEEEFREMISSNKLETLYFHHEPNCYSGRFKKVICAE